MSQFQFNAAEVEPQQSFAPLPAGIYVAQITDVEIKDTKAGTGQYLQITWEIADGECRGRKVWDRLNVSNANAEAERIGRQQLSALCHAIGVLQVQDTNQFHGKAARIRVTVRKDATYGDGNDVKGYEAAGARPMPTGGFPPAAAAAAAPAAPRRPW